MSKDELLAKILARRGDGGAMCTCVPLNNPQKGRGKVDAAAARRAESAAAAARIGSTGTASAD